LSTPLAAVHNSTVSLSPDSPLLLVSPTGIIPSGEQDICRVNTAFILMEADLDNWAKSWGGAYSTAVYTVQGTVSGTGISNVLYLTTNTKIGGVNFVTKNTTFQINLEVGVSAKLPASPFTEDPVPNYTAQVSFTSVIQIKFKTS